MHQVLLTDRIYDEVKRRADQAGFTSVDDYVVEVLTQDALPTETEELGHLFTPERLDHVDKVIANIKSGSPTYTLDEVRDNLAKHRAVWIQKNNQ